VLVRPVPSPLAILPRDRRALQTPLPLHGCLPVPSRAEKQIVGAVAGVASAPAGAYSKTYRL